MKVFISWSGENSRVVAEKLRGWLKFVIQHLEPWVSSEDMRKGGRWLHELSTQLQDSGAAVVCLTRDNLHSPWILFEAGALVRSIENTIVCPYLVGLEPREVSGPLAQFQSAIASKPETYRLLKSINDALPDHRLSDELLKATFEKWWPDLEQTLTSIVPDPDVSKVPVRTDRHVLDEMLEILRAQSNQRIHAGEPMREYHVAFQLEFPEANRRISIAVGPETTVRSVMDALCTDLRGLVPNFSYMEKWIVRGKEGGKPRVVIREVQERIPAQSVFAPGSEWEVVPLSKPYSPDESLRNLKG